MASTPRLSVRVENEWCGVVGQRIGDQVRVDRQRAEVARLGCGMTESAERHYRGRYYSTEHRASSHRAILQSVISAGIAGPTAPAVAPEPSRSAAHVAGRPTAIEHLDVGPVRRRRLDVDVGVVGV